MSIRRRRGGVSQLRDAARSPPFVPMSCSRPRRLPHLRSQQSEHLRAAGTSDGHGTCQRHVRPGPAIMSQCPDRLRTHAMATPPVHAAGSADAATAGAGHDSHRTSPPTSRHCISLPRARRPHYGASNQGPHRLAICKLHYRPRVILIAIIRIR